MSVAGKLQRALHSTPGTFPITSELELPFSPLHIRQRPPCSCRIGLRTESTLTQGPRTHASDIEQHTPPVTIRRSPTLHARRE